MTRKVHFEIEVIRGTLHYKHNILINELTGHAEDVPCKEKYKRRREGF
jgi:hypothetical protein